MSRFDQQPIPQVVPAANCSNCRNGGQQGPVLVCRFNPPIPMIMMQQGLAGAPQPVTAALWAPVSNMEWCSKHAQKLTS